MRQFGIPAVRFAYPTELSIGDEASALAVAF